MNNNEIRYAMLPQNHKSHMAYMNPYILLRFLRLFVILTAAITANVSADATIHPWRPGDLARTRCVEGLERFVPAHVYYCLAIQSYGLHQYQATPRLLHQAALWGSKQAEYVLGYMAMNGDHQPVNKPEAIAWFSLAAERHTPFFEKAYDSLRRQATAAELAQSQSILRALGPNYADAIAAPRAEERYHEGMLWLDSHRANDNICLSGMITPKGTTGTASPQLAGHCPTPPQLTKEVNIFTSAVLADWGGHVDVRPLQQVKDRTLGHGHHK